MAVKTLLTTYGVFENDRCIIVGSTEKSLEHRAKQYSRFKWFDNSKHVHKILWQGFIIADDLDQLRFIRAVKETLMISHMDTWYDLGGKNQTNPIVQAMGMPFGYSDIGKRYGHLGGQVKSVAKYKHLMEMRTKEFLQRANAALPQTARVKGGQTQGKINAETGHMSRIGREQGLKNKENGHLAKILHIRWHINRNIINSECVLCQK